ncbi:MAG: anti-sigma factor [Actinomycetota bacterium]
MQHSDGDDRLLAALRGQRVSGETPAEAGELRAAQRIGDLARLIEAEVPDDAARLFDDRIPPLTDFDSIADALGDELYESPVPTFDEVAEPVAFPDDDFARRSAELIHLRPRRRISPKAWLPTAAAAMIAILAGAVYLFQDGPDDQIIASTPLGAELQGSATAELRGDGSEFELAVEIEGLAAEDGYLELWLIDTEVSQLISLGPIQEDGVYRLPAGLDPADFPIVDVSVESFDGDPTHSGQTVFRGQLDL